jgi:hypothetical protein
MLDLRTPVYAYVPAPGDTKIEARPGTIIARTIEERARYDVRLDDGRLLVGLAEEWIREAA